MLFLAFSTQFFLAAPSRFMRGGGKTICFVSPPSFVAGGQLLLLPPPPSAALANAPSWGSIDEVASEIQ